MRRDPTEEISLQIELSKITFEQAEKLFAVHSPQLSNVGAGTIPIVIVEVEKLLSWAPEDVRWVAAHVPDSPIATESGTRTRKPSSSRSSCRDNVIETRYARFLFH